MSSNVSNLGRAFCRVILYEKLPNLVVDTTKLRKSYLFALAMQDDQQIYDKTNFGVQYIGIEGPDGNVSGGLLPAICYEPVDNYMSSTTASTTSKVVWNKMDWNSINNSTRFVYTGLPVANMFFSQIKEDPDVALPENQSWTNAEKSVYTYRYNEQDYMESIAPITGGLTSGSGTGATSGAATGSGSGGPVSGVETKSYVYQQNGGIGSWWGASTEPFKLFAGGVWVSIFAQQAFVSDDPDMRKTSWLCIKFNADFGYQNGNNTPYFLFISNRGQTFVRYLLGKRITDVNVNMPHLSEAFRNGEEIRVGFFTMASRIILYTDQYRYTAVDINQLVALSNGKIESQLYSGYAFRMKNVEVYGYGCSAFVNAGEMTFFKKSWMILDAKGEDNYVGYKAPELDAGGVTAGTWADGSLISWNIGNEQYLQNNNNPMYAAQFGYYLEVDEVQHTIRPVVRGNVSTPTGNGDQETSAHASGLIPFGMFNSYPKWGKILIKRSLPVSGISSVNFWYVFFETEDIEDTALTTPITHQRVGYPVMYNFFGKIDFDSTKNTGLTMETFSAIEVTDDVLSVEISSQLDSPDKFSSIVKTATINLYDGNETYTKYLTRARGVKIWLKWGTDESSGIDPLVDIPSFTGVAFGEKYSMRPGSNSITINCTDYWNIVDRMNIKNSPFYDGFELVSVVRDLANRVGVFVQDDIDHTNIGFYYLGSGFSFDKPMHRYQANDSLKECMMKTIQMFPYYLWFDNQCVLHVSVVPADFDWGQTGVGWDNTVYKYYYRNISSIPHDYPEKLILNEINLTSTLSTSVYNSFMITGVKRINNQAVPATGSRSSSILDPDSVGFLGFVAEKEHRQPALDDNSVQIYLDRFMKMFAAPGYQTEIQTVGHLPPYRCGQFIKILQTPANDQEKFRVTSIRQQYDAEKNSWLTTISAYQITQVGWAPATTP